MFNYTTTSDVLGLVAKYIKRTRIAQRIKLEDLASRAGIGTATLSRIEKTGICSTENLFKVLASLGKLEQLGLLFKEEESLSISELRAIKKKKTERRRVR